MVHIERYFLTHCVEKVMDNNYLQAEVFAFAHCKVSSSACLLIFAVHLESSMTDVVNSKEKYVFDYEINK